MAPSTPPSLLLKKIFLVQTGFLPGGYLLVIVFPSLLRDRECNIPLLFLVPNPRPRQGLYSPPRDESFAAGEEREIGLINAAKRPIGRWGGGGEGAPNWNP